MYSQRLQIAGACIFATRRGMTVAGVGCLSNNDNMALKGRFDGIHRRGDPPEQVWFCINGRVGELDLAIIGAQTSSQDFRTREGVEGVAVAVVLEGGETDFKAAIDWVYELLDANGSQLSGKYADGLRFTAPRGFPDLDEQRRDFTARSHGEITRVRLPSNWQDFGPREDYLAYLSEEFEDDFVIVAPSATSAQDLRGEVIRDWKRNANERRASREARAREAEVRAGRDQIVVREPPGRSSDREDRVPPQHAPHGQTTPLNQTPSMAKGGRSQPLAGTPAHMQSQGEMSDVLVQHERRIRTLERTQIGAIVLAALALTLSIFAMMRPGPEPRDTDVLRNRQNFEQGTTNPAPVVEMAQTPPPIEEQNPDIAAASGPAMSSTCGGLEQLSESLVALSVCEQMKATENDDPERDGLRRACVEALNTVGQNLSAVRECPSPIANCAPRDFGNPNLNTYRSQDWDRVRQRIECLRAQD